MAPVGSVASSQESVETSLTTPGFSLMSLGKAAYLLSGESIEDRDKEPYIR